MLKKGIYEQIINKETERDIKRAEDDGMVCVQQTIDGAESPHILADYLAKVIRKNSLLQAVKAERFIIYQIDTIKGYRDTLSNNAYHIKKSRTLPAL